MTSPSFIRQVLAVYRLFLLLGYYQGRPEGIETAAPRVTTGNTMAPCVIIGERAAEAIRTAYKL
jgi:hypothetical protein